MPKVKKELKEIRVIYDGFSEKVDKALEKVAKQLSYEFNCSSYNFRTKKRDLSFTKE